MSSAPLHVLELGEGVSAAYAGKLLGDHGADVIKIEPPQGDKSRRRGPFPQDIADPECSGQFLALNINKRGICLDLDSRAGRNELNKLLAWADILVHNFPRLSAAAHGIDPVTIAAQHSDLLVLSITPFGITGPYCDYVAEELTIANAGGWAQLCPGTHTDPDLAPLKVFGSQCGLMAGIAGAMTALALWRDVRRTGVGDYIDLSEQQYVASCVEGCIPFYTYTDEVMTRSRVRSLIPWKIFQAKDAPVFLVCIEEDQWQRLVELMGTPDWTQLDVFSDHASRSENQDMVHALVQEFVGQWSALDLYHEAQKRRICMMPVMDLEQLGSAKQLRERDFFVKQNHERAGTLEYLASATISTAGRMPITRVAPRLGEHTSEVLADRLPGRSPPSPVPVSMPLAGIRVLDLTMVWAGPFASMNLAFLGAEVIRVESETHLDLYRRLPNLMCADLEPGVNRCGMFNQWNQGKSSLALNLRSPCGLTIIKELLAQADVVVQNFATGVLERLGLGYEVLKTINPGIILASISGYGQTGPERHYMGYGPAIPPLAGLSYCTGYVGGEPEEFGVSMPDPTAGLTASLAIVSALEKREHTGVGDHLDISLWEATAVLAVEAWMQYAMNKTQPTRIGNRDPNMAPHGCFACQGEDGWISIACASDAHWLKLCDLIDPSLASDLRFTTLADRKANEDQLETIVARWTRDRDRWEMTTLLQARGVAAFPAMTSQDLVGDPHLNQRGFIERLVHPEVGARAHTGIPWRLKRRGNGVRRPAPCLGADTDRLLTELLGYDEKTLSELRQQQILR